MQYRPRAVAPAQAGVHGSSHSRHRPPTGPRPSPWDILYGAALALLIALGVGYRLYHFATAPFWLDEAYSAYAADHGFAFLWHVVPRYETHPPAYYSLVRVWSLVFGETLGARRALGAAAGIAAIPAAALAAWRLATVADWPAERARALAGLAAALVALQPLAIQMSRQVRPYPVMTLVYALGIAAVLALGRDAARGRLLSRRALIGFALAEAALLWLHTLGPLFGGSLALACVILVVRRGLRPGDGLLLAGTQAFAALAYLPAFLIMLGQAPTWVRSTWLAFRPDWLPTQIAVLYADWHTGALTAVAVAAAIGVAMLARRGPGARAAAALLVLAGLPVAVAAIVSATVSPIFLVRTLSPVAVPALLLAAAGLTLPGPGRWAGAALAAFLLWTEAVVAQRVATAPPPQDWYAALRWLAPRFHPGDMVWAYPNEGALPLAYALGDRHARLPIRAIPGPVPAFGLGGHFVTGSQGVVSLNDREIAALVTRPDAKAPRTIWVLRLGPWKYDPGDALVHALAADRTIVGHWRRGAIDWTGLRAQSPASAGSSASQWSISTVAPRVSGGRSE